MGLTRGETSEKESDSRQLVEFFMGLVANSYEDALRKVEKSPRRGSNKQAVASVRELAAKNFLDRLQVAERIILVLTIKAKGSVNTDEVSHLNELVRLAISKSRRLACKNFIEKSIRVCEPELQAEGFSICPYCLGATPGGQSFRGFCSKKCWKGMRNRVGYLERKPTSARFQ